MTSKSNRKHWARRNQGSEAMHATDFMEGAVLPRFFMQRTSNLTKFAALKFQGGNRLSVSKNNSVQVKWKEWGSHTKSVTRKGHVLHEQPQRHTVTWRQVRGYSRHKTYSLPGWNLPITLWKRLWWVPGGRDGRVTILHAVHSGGWVNNCAYIRVQGEVNSRDYHDKMNTKHFMQWFTNSLLPSRPPSAEIVLETAKYGAQK